MIIRQTGETSRQIVVAPKNAIFVWCRPQVGYARDLARSLGRSDLEIVGWLGCGHPESAYVFRGCSREVVFDHAVEMTRQQRDELREMGIIPAPTEGK